jgi:hypothetical protein
MGKIQFGVLKKFLFVLTGAVIVTLFAHAVLAAERSEAGSSNSTFGYNQIKRSNSSFNFELNFNDIPIKPDVFYDDTLNGEKLKVQGVSGTLSKGFALGDYAFITVGAKYGSGEAKSTVGSSEFARKTRLEMLQGLIHLGFNVRTIMVDHAIFHPFVGGGYSRMTLTDSYTNTDETSDYNKIIETGTVIEYGFHVIDHYSGMYSTFRAGRLSTSSRTYDTSMPDEAGVLPLSMHDAGQINPQSFYSVGFGIKF